MDFTQIRRTSEIFSAKLIKILSVEANMGKQQNKLRIASKHGSHEAHGWFAIFALVLIVVVPTVAAIFLW